LSEQHESIFEIHADFSIALEGGFFLTKKPLSSMASVYTNTENAIGSQLEIGSKSHSFAMLT
jgi:hypothetical protein